MPHREISLSGERLILFDCPPDPSLTTVDSALGTRNLCKLSTTNYIGDSL